MGSYRDKLKNSAAAGSGSNSIKVINMQNKANYGSLFCVPFTPKDDKDAVTVLDGVTEVLDHYSGTDKDGKAYSGKRWLKLLAKSDLKLTDEESAAYSKIKALTKKLESHTYSSNKKRNDEIKKEIIRRKSYTLLFVYVVEHKDLNGKVILKNTPALLVFSSKGFDNALDKALTMKDEASGGPEWESRLFNRNLDKRTLFLAITYRLFDKSEKKIGYNCGVTIERTSDENRRITGSKSDDTDYFNFSSTPEILEQFTNHVDVFLNLKGRSPFNDEYTDVLVSRISKYFDKYISGGSNPTDPAPSKASGIEGDGKIQRDIWDDPEGPDDDMPF